MTTLWTVTNHVSNSSLRGLCVVDARTIWTSGSGGTILRSVDGGDSWESCDPADGSALDFRDVHAFDDQRALVISAGAPARIYSTDNGGQSWSLVHEDLREGVFFDAMAFSDERTGFAFSDPVDGRFLVVRTDDGGRTWRELERGHQPRAMPGEAGFAASGTCLCLFDGRMFIGLGGDHEGSPPRARVLASDDEGANWSEAGTPLPSSESSGVFSLAFVNRDHGVAIGGDYQDPENATGNACYTTDGGINWHIPAELPGGYRSCVAARRVAEGFQLVCIGPTGSDLSVDDGRTWQALDNEGFHAVAFSPDGVLGVASGGEGKIGLWRP